MEATELGRKLLDDLSKTDERLLREVQTVVEKYKNDQIVAHNIQVEPLNKEAFQREIAEAEEEFEKGIFTTHEQLKQEKELEKRVWTKRKRKNYILLNKVEK